MQNAIETVYNGFRFRSRLEARWAIFYDSLGVEYRYEPEAFDLGNGLVYLPDFQVPSPRLWIEIKPTLEEAQREEVRKKARLLAKRTRDLVFVFYGDVWPPEDEPARGAYCYEWWPGGSCVMTSAGYGFRDCAACGAVSLGRLDLPCVDCNEQTSFRTTRLLTAYTAARQARFDGWWRNRTRSDLAP